jgi:hypothetical protein
MIKLSIQKNATHVCSYRRISLPLGSHHRRRADDEGRDNSDRVPTVQQIIRVSTGHRKRAAPAIAKHPVAPSDFSPFAHRRPCLRHTHFSMPIHDGGYTYDCEAPAASELFPHEKFTRAQVLGRAECNRQKMPSLWFKTAPALAVVPHIERRNFGKNFVNAQENTRQIGARDERKAARLLSPGFTAIFRAMERYECKNQERKTRNCAANFH